MPKIKRKEHQIEPDKEEDIIIKSSGFRFYFQNFYNLISLTNDLLTGLMYMIASVLSLMGVPSIYSTSLYLLGAVFLTFRPLIKIVHNVFLYNDRGKDENDEEGQSETEEDLNEAEKDRDQAEEDRKQAEKDREQAEEDRKKAEENQENQGDQENESQQDPSIISKVLPGLSDYEQDQTDEQEKEEEREKQRDEEQKKRDKAARERELAQKERELNQENHEDG
ncbi:YrhK-like protein [Pisciglobus halotolerans]|uniref:YrhK-like protein n=1 Tax=Pisciglobus halotolerans TaxID=745365 RepID=A0A1I3C6D1_9LACT|nr:YrhK-like protein [Pisciglobus halotolerans]